MPKLKILSGSEVIKILEDFGFVVASRKGSHVKLKRILKNGVKEILTVPSLKELDKGTLRAIVRQASRYIPMEQLISQFYEQ